MGLGLVLGLGLGLGVRVRVGVGARAGFGFGLNARVRVTLRFAVSISSPLIHSRRTYPRSGGGIGTCLVSRWRVMSGTTAPSAQSSSVGSSRNSKVASSFGSPTWSGVRG